MRHRYYLSIRSAVRGDLLSRFAQPDKDHPRDTIGGYPEGATVPIHYTTTLQLQGYRRA